MARIKSPTQPFFVNNRGMKVNAKNYLNHLKKELFPTIEEVYKRNDWIFVQDGAPSHRSNLVQEFLEETMQRRYAKRTEWLPRSPDSNPLDYYFWSQLKKIVYEGRMNRPFTNEDEIKRRIRKMWNECANNTVITSVPITSCWGKERVLHKNDVWVKYAVVTCMKYVMIIFYKNVNKYSISFYSS